MEYRILLFWTVLFPFMETISPKSSYCDLQVKETMAKGLENMGGKMNKDWFHICVQHMEWVFF